VGCPLETLQVKRLAATHRGLGVIRIRLLDNFETIYKVSSFTQQRSEML
jgi:hypothetical protein